MWSLGIGDTLELRRLRRTFADEQGAAFRRALAADQAMKVTDVLLKQTGPSKAVAVPSTVPALLQEIANRTGGRYYESYDEETFRRHFAELERTEFQTRTRTRHKDAFAPLVLLALAAIGLEVLLHTSVLRKFP